MKDKRAPLLALLLGGGCAAARLTVWRSAYDTATLLANPDGSLLHFNLTAAAVCLLCFLLGRHDSDAQESERLYACGSPVGDLLMVLGGVAALLSGGALIRNPDVWNGNPVVNGLLIGLGLVSGLSMLILVIRGAAWQKGLFRTAMLFPPMTLCFWLVGFYHRYGVFACAAAYFWPMAAMLLSGWAWLAYGGVALAGRSGRNLNGLACAAVTAAAAACASPQSLAFCLAAASQLLWFAGLSLRISRAENSRKAGRRLSAQA